MAMDSLWLIPLVLGVAAVLNLAGERHPARAWSPRVAGGVTMIALLGAFALSVRAVASLRRLPSGATERLDVLGDWIPKLPVATRDTIGILDVPWGLRLDASSAVALGVSLGISLIVALLLIGGLLVHAARLDQKSRDERAARFAYLGGAAAFLIVIALGSSLPMLLAGWSAMVMVSALLDQRPDQGDGESLAMSGSFGVAGFAMAVAFAFVTFGSLDVRAVDRAVATIQVPPGRWAAADTIAFAIALSVVTVAGLRLVNALTRKRRWLSVANAGQWTVSAGAWLLAAATFCVLWQVRSLAVRAPLAIGIAVVCSGLIIATTARRHATSV